MEDKDILIARVKELSQRAINQSFLTHTNFLSLSEQNIFFQYLKENGLYQANERMGDVSYALYGGHEESDRKVLFFLPYYLDKAKFLEEEKNGNTITCLHIYPKNRKFSDILTHRDYLGALMHLGYEREEYGDILTDGTDGYLFVLKTIAPFLKEELTKIKHTVVDVEEVSPLLCPFKQQFEDKTIHIASNRLDCVLAEVFNLSRRSSQEAIGQEMVFVDGMTIKNNAYEMKENQRVSLRGKGKFLYLGHEKETKKGRLVTTVKIYK